jgi:hypothetical protein
MKIPTHEIERLSRFARQVHKVFASSIVQERRFSCSVEVTFLPGQMTADGAYADGDPLEALANKVRVFTLARDGIRVEDVHAILERILTTPGARELLANARAAWEQAKAGNGIALTIDGERITPYRAFEIWFYGHVAHANPDKAEDFDKHESSPITRHMLKFMIHEFLVGVLDPLDQLCMLAQAVVSTGREPRYAFRPDAEGRVWSVSLEDGTAVPTPDFPYEQYGMARPPELAP